MSFLENISTSELQNAIEDVNDIHPTKRLMIAIAYKQRVSQMDLAD
jgi:hypothetical protein